jgi:hypothetical protein
MAVKSIVLGSALTVALAAGAFYAGGGLGSRPAWADAAAGHWSSERRHGDGHFERLCTDGDDARIALVMGMARDHLNLKPVQAASWQDLEGAVGKGLATLRGACQTLRAGERGASAPARLAAAEAAMTAGGAALRQIRPAFEAFYGTLDAGQKATLDDALSRGRHR